MTRMPDARAKAEATPITATGTDVAYINGEAHPIIQGETILDLLRRTMDPEPVPTLCDAPNLEPFGSCRVCSVEVALAADGPTRVMASCHTPVAKGSTSPPTARAWSACARTSWSWCSPTTTPNS
jgi:predicted molibdopterin-dependent oxidoreductase YjgC